MAQSEKHMLMSLSPNRATAEVGWHRRAGAYEDAYIEKIEDPSNAVMTRILTAIPSPFARVHLFDAAFHFAARSVDGVTDFHQMVSDCLDVLELLYSLEDHATEVTIERWTPSSDLLALEKSLEYGQRLLASTLSLYLAEDKMANFPRMPVFYQLLIKREIIAISSPLTLFLTAPEARATAAVHLLINADTQRPYFSVIRPLHARRADFQLYLYHLFAMQAADGGPPLSALCRRMNTYLDRNEEFVTQTNRELALAIRELRRPGAATSAISLTPLVDALQEPVKILGLALSKRPSRLLPRLMESPIALRSSRLKPGALPPIVWTGTTDSFGAQHSQGDLPPTLPPMGERVLPDLHSKYPFLCAADLIEDRIVRVPFLMNARQFCVPRYENFEPGLEFSFLLPIKREFFEYFEPRAIASMAVFRRVGDGVIFELTIPTLAKTLTFQKTYFESPLQSKYGKIVSAGLNCALYPFLSIKDTPRFSNRYWVMLVDAERDPAVRSTSCFDLRFFRSTLTEIAPFVENQPGAPLSVVTTRRSDKAVEAGSTYYELTGARCDFIEVESFSFEPERKGTAMIVPNWEEKTLGTRKARVAIDFGTTNTHMAWRLDDELPTPFQVGPADVQVALLNAPDGTLALEAQRYDMFSGRLAGTGIRLHHEFLPSIIGEGSRFHFPMRTATSERLNLQFGEFNVLRTINISFIYGLDPARAEERIVTDLKWSLEAAPDMKQRVNAFLEELLFLIRTKLLMHDVDPSQIVLMWFRPLSFTFYTKSQFESIWKERAASVLGLPPGRVTNLTESEAPYYYHHMAGMITNNPTVCIDIGGGSTDVVFFDGREPRFGTSFGFAGNALWGSGYDRAGARDSGVARSLKALIAERLEGATRKQTPAETMFTLFMSRASSEEFMNFCFASDAEFHIAEALAENNAAKTLALIHFSSIIYHCAQLMKAKGMDVPEYLCLSGRGSQYLNILDRTPQKTAIARLSQCIVEEVFGVKLQHPIRLSFAAQSKEATCNGGLYKHLQIAEGGEVLPTAEPLPLVELGDGGPAPAGAIHYGDLNAAIKSAVATNLERFVDLIVALSARPEIQFKNYFGVTLPTAEVTRILKQKLVQSIDRGLEPHVAKPEEELNETLFFYPLIHNLYELGNELL